MSGVIPTGEQKAANKHLLPTATGGAAGPSSPFPEQQKKAGLKKCTGAGLNIGLCFKRLAGENKKRLQLGKGPVSAFQLEDIICNILRP